MNDTLKDVVTTGVVTTVGAVKDLADVRKANADRKLANECRKQLPEVLSSLKNNLRSDTELNEAKTRATQDIAGIVDDLKVNLRSGTQRNEAYIHAMKETTDHSQRVAASKIQKNQTKEWTSVMNASSIQTWTQSTDSNVGNIAGSMNGIAQSADKVVRELEGVQVVTKSLVDRADYYGRFMQISTTTFLHQMQQTIDLLGRIEDNLADHNSILVSGSGGPEGAAKFVYEFIEMRIEETEGENHRFFVYHPDTVWCPHFYKMIKDKPLPPTFCAKSDDLDKICRYMQSCRKELNDEKRCGKDVVFHLLIPAYGKISIKEPLHFPDDLQPLRVEGTKFKGEGLVKINLPVAPKNLLYGVDNYLDPKWQNKTADIAAAATTLVGTGWGVNGLCLALGVGLGAFTGLGALVTIPVWFSTASYSMPIAADAIHGAVHDSIREAPPRILGSNTRLDIPRSTFH